MNSVQCRWQLRSHAAGVVAGIVAASSCLCAPSASAIASAPGGSEKTIEVRSAMGRGPRPTTAPAQTAPPAGASEGDLSAREVTEMLGDALRGAEQRDVLEFFEKHAPERFKLFSSFREGGQRRARLLEFMTRRYTQLQRTRDNDAKLYELQVRQMELQDKSFAMVRDSQQQGQEPPDQQELRKNVRELIDLTLQERQRRIEMLEDKLKEQKAQLERDRAGLDELVEQHINQMMEESKRFMERLRDLRPSRGTGQPAPSQTSPSQPPR